jgi:hypothetical protein
MHAKAFNPRLAVITRTKESSRNRNAAILLAAIATMALATSAAAQTCALQQEVEVAGGGALLPPRIDRIGVRATLLYRGMPAANVERIMGKPARVDLADDEESSVRVLRYPSEPIGTTVTITDGRVSGVALDVAGIDDPSLPDFSRTAWVGLSRPAVLRLFGEPADDRLRDGYGMTVEQMVFRRPCGSEVSIFLINGRVVTKKVGSSFPSDILSFALPLAPDPAGGEIDDVPQLANDQNVAVGIKASAVQALFGAPKMHVDYTFKGRPAEYAIYETSPGKSFGRFTFIDGVLTKFADGGNTPLTQVLDGR